MGLTLLHKALMTPGHQTMMTGLLEYRQVGFLCTFSDLGQQGSAPMGK
ncbi:hypothetical protein ACFLT7_06615 [candidate division KSB1 bacterium]